MQLPFTPDQFIGVFTNYNATIGYAPIAAYGLAVAAIALAVWGRGRGDKAIALTLAGLWAFTGVGYHVMSFAAINPVAGVFGAAFVLQAVLLAFHGLRGSLRFRFENTARSWTGIAIMAWAMVGYPLAGAALGHGYPHGPVFGLTPCPLLLFTIGMMLMSEGAPRHLSVIPVLWAIVGTSAAVSLGIREDFTLALATMVSAGFGIRAALATRSRRARGTQAPARLDAPADAA